MKPEELRIGNYVYPFDDGHLCTDKEIFNDRIKVTPKDFENTEHLYPILLTEEWLFKFGFVKNSELKYHWKNWGTNGVIIITFDETYQGYLFQLGKGLNKLLTNVHQLQNLYFALTGEELTIK